MKLLFVTQVLDRDDAVLGFVMRWVLALAERTERLRVIALQAGDLSGLPDNVDVRIVGRRGGLRRLLRYRRYLNEAFGRGPEGGFDSLLTHMVPRYSNLAARKARAAGVRHCLWYTHKGVDQRLRRAVRVVDKVFTASPESLRIATPKCVVTGHGIDVQHFDARALAPDDPPRILWVGRFSPAKDPFTLLAALAILVGEGRDVHLDLVGDALAPGDAEYVERFRAELARRGLSERVHLAGAVPYPNIPAYYGRATLCASTSHTGSVDKVVLEAMAAGRPVVTCNESFPPIFAELGPDAEKLVFAKRDAEQLASKLATLLDESPAERAALGARLRTIVCRDHEVEALIARLVTEMERPG